MKTFTALLIISFVACACALDISYTGNISGSVDGNGWQYRETSLTDLDIFELSTEYTSGNAEVHKGSASYDLLYGALTIPVDTFPYVILAYFTGSASFTPGQGASSFNATSSAGYIANGYLYLQEKNSSGSIVHTISLKQPIINIFNGAFGWTRLSSAQTSNGLSWASFIGQPEDNSWNITLTFIASNVAGTINYGNAVVGPKTVETVISIQGYPYKSSSNTLTLAIAVATGEAEATATGHAHTLSSGSGNAKMYFSTSGNYLHHGSVKAAQVSEFAAGNFSSSVGDGTSWEGQVNGKYGAQATLKVVTVTFAAGATDIVYDPAVGAGAVITQPNAAPAISSSMLLVFVFLFAAMLI